MSSKPITFGRYQKVEAILEADRAIKAKLGPKTEIVCRPPPSNEKAFFAKPVVFITEALHANGADAHTTSRTDVLKLALKLVQEGDGTFKIPEITHPPVATETNKPVTEPKKEASVKPVIKKATSGLAKAVIKKAPSEPVKAVAGTKSPVVKKEDKVAPEAEEGPTRLPAPLTLMAAAKRALSDPTLPYAYGVSLTSLLLTADQIIEAHDRSPGRKERQQKLADLIRDYMALTVIPKSVKENSPSSE